MVDLAETQRAGNCEQPPSGVCLRISPRALLILCLFAQAWLVILHVRLANHPTPGVEVLGQAFDLTRESSVPTFFACLQAIGVALTALAMVFILRSQKLSRDHWIGWLIVAAIFLVVAIDDAGGLHERAGSIVSLDLMAQLGYPSYPWHVFVLPFIGGGLLFAFYLIWQDLSKTPGARLLIGIAIFCFVGSQGIDFAEGVDRMSNEFLQAPSKSLPAWMALEETLEMCGTALVWCAFLACLKRKVVGLSFAFVPEEAPEREAVDAVLAPVLDRA